MGVDHLLHPVRLAGEVAVVGSGGCDCRHQLRPVDRIGPDGRHDDSRRLGESGHVVGVVGVGDDPLDIGAGVGRHPLELLRVSAGDRPTQLAVCAMALDEVPAQDLSGEARRSEDDDVERSVEVRASHAESLGSCRRPTATGEPARRDSGALTPGAP